MTHRTDSVANNSAPQMKPGERKRWQRWRGEGPAAEGSPRDYHNCRHSRSRDTRAPVSKPAFGSGGRNKEGCRRRPSGDGGKLDAAPGRSMQQYIRACTRVMGVGFRSGWIPVGCRIVLRQGTTSVENQIPILDKISINIGAYVVSVSPVSEPIFVGMSKLYQNQDRYRILMLYCRYI